MDKILDLRTTPTPTPAGTKEEKMYGTECECCYQEDDLHKYLRKLLLYLQLGGNSLWIIFLLISIVMLFRKQKQA